MTHQNTTETVENARDGRRSTTTTFCDPNEVKSNDVMSLIALGRQDSRAVKRPKLNLNQQQLHFSLGAVTKIELTNFMCHASLVMEPGPAVNVITGRNGAGKSSILQALVIGLGAYNITGVCQLLLSR